MVQPGSFDVSSAEEAAVAFDYFNGFHDGFMKRIDITSRDAIDEDHGQSCSGLFDVDIEFAHYNYADGEAPFHPHNQIVHAVFLDVQDIFGDFREGFLGNTIINLSVVPVNRRRGASTDTETALGLQLARHYYLEEFRRFELRQSQLFTFTSATFREQSPGQASDR